MLRRIEHRRHPRTSPLILPKFSSLQGSIALQCQIFKIRPLLITIRLKPCLHNENLALGVAIGYSFQGCLKNPKIGYLNLSLVRGCIWMCRSLHKVLKLKYGKPDDAVASHVGAQVPTHLSTHFVQPIVWAAQNPCSATVLLQ